MKTGLGGFMIRSLAVTVLALVSAGSLNAQVSQQPEARLVLREETRLGSLDKKSGQTFLATIAAVAADDGWIYVLQVSENEVRAFDPAGRLAWSRGKAADHGSRVNGFWRFPAKLELSGDTLAVLDAHGPGIHLIDRHTGRPLTGPGGASVVVPQVPDNPMVSILRIAPTQSGWVSLTDKTTGKGKSESVQLTANPLSLRTGALGPVLWTTSSRIVWTVGRQGLYAADSLGSRIELYSAKHGAAPQTIEVALPRPAGHRIVGYMLAAPDGSLAIVREDLTETATNVRDSVFIQVTRPDGSTLGFAALPPGFSLVQFTGRSLLGFETDSNSVVTQSRESGRPLFLKQVVKYEIAGVDRPQ
jgi:hypothetical protein